MEENNINNVEQKFKVLCGFCKNFHTFNCPAESHDNAGVFLQEEDSEPFEENCFEVNPNLKERKDLIDVFSKLILRNYTIKHFVKNGSIGLFKWVNGRYVECEEELRHLIEKLGTEFQIQEKVKTHLVNEVIEKIKRITYFKIEEEPKKIAFENCVLDWQAFLSIEKKDYIIPIESTKETPVFHYIPHKLNIELLKKCIENFENGVKNIIEEQFPEIVKIFKMWVEEDWILLFEIIGYCLYPDYPFGKAFMLIGDGRNGKSTYLKLVQKILGNENVSSISLQDLCLYRFAPISLYHKLANIFPDIPSKAINYTGYFKALTGDDLISAHRKFKEPLLFKNYAKLIFSANELPEVQDMTEAFWRRWILIEFPNKFEDNPNFFEEVFNEEVIEKIIVFSIMAFVNVFLCKSFSTKEGVIDFKEKWLRKVNSVYAYVRIGVEDGWLLLDEKESTTSEVLYNDYVEWCDMNDVNPVNKATFTKELERLFKIQKKRKREGGKRTYVYSGIKLERKIEEEPTLDDSLYL